jgi:hypothetical protein
MRPEQETQMLDAAIEVSNEAVIPAISLLSFDKIKQRLLTYHQTEASHLLYAFECNLHGTNSLGYSERIMYQKDVLICFTEVIISSKPSSLRLSKKQLLHCICLLLGYSNDTIATLQGVTLQTLYVQKHRLKEKLPPCLFAEIIQLHERCLFLYTHDEIADLA